MLSTSLLHSHSLSSLTEITETISETEEIIEVKSLCNKGIKAAKLSAFEDAINFYNEALDIDAGNIGVLQARALALLERGKNTEALADADAILVIDSSNAKGYLLQGIAYKRLNMLKASLDSLLAALDLDAANSLKIVDYLASTVVKMCQGPVKLNDYFQTMNTYEKLSELGVVLLNTKKYEACISVLTAAAKFQTNQKGIILRVLMTQASAHSQLMHVSTAIATFQECWGISVANHDQACQAKCLVNIATLHLGNGNTQQAIIFYEKLLHLEAELLEEAGSGGSLPDFWTKELQCGLHLNMSIAYKTVGNLPSAAMHAKKYMELAEQFKLSPQMVVDSHHNMGLMQEVLGKYQAAIDSYNLYLQKSLDTGNQKAAGQAYGCLASVNSALKRWSTSLTYHKQHLDVALQIKDKKMMVLANEMLADTLCLMGNFEEAIGHYNQVLTLCKSRDKSGEATTCCKMAAAYKNMGQTQYSLFYYREALNLAEKFGYTDLETLAQFHIACILKDSTQYIERDGAQRTFMKLIPYLEKKIAQHQEENSYYPEVYEEQLAQCYDGMQTILSSMSNKLGCLQYAEAHRKRSVISLPNFESTCRVTNHSLDVNVEVWESEHINKIVSIQNATVLYYSLLDNILLLWVLSPGAGVARFYTTKGTDSQNLTKKISRLLLDLKEGWNSKDLLSTSETRALPVKHTDIQYIKSDNTSSSTIKQEESISSTKSDKPALYQLYHLLIYPVVDILDQLEEGSHLIIVPDKELRLCPFGALMDNQDNYLCDRFHISYIPCLMLLDRVIQNELTLLSLQDDLDTERRLTCLGGVVKFCKEHSTEIFSQYDSSTENSEVEEPINPRELSNPKLLIHRSPANCAAKSMTPYVQISSTPNGHRASPRVNKRTFQSKLADCSPGQKQLAVHTYTTVSAETWTHTDVTSSSLDVPHFRQVSDPRTALVFGSPSLHGRSVIVHNKEWKTNSLLEKADTELTLVAHCLGTDRIVGAKATRQELLNRLEHAEVVHIATWACLKEGQLLVTPSPLSEESEDSSHIVTVTDILSLKLRAKVIVLSTSGLSAARLVQECPLKLASAFLSAGAQCVLISMWPVPDDMLHKFFFHFYFTLQKSAFISAALNKGVKAIREDKRWSHVCHWAGFKLIGKDTKVSLSEIRHAELDQLIDRCEKEAELTSQKLTLNRPEVIPTVLSKEENLNILQKHIKLLLQDLYKNPTVIPCLTDMVDAALKRLHNPENNKELCVLADDLAGSDVAFTLLHWLGFHFQPKGKQIIPSYVMFPHWNKDQLLIPTYDALKAVKELSASTSLTTALYEALPLSQENISYMVDLMCITKHAPEIQLKVTDLSVQPMWHSSKLKNLLVAIGYHQVGLLLTFNMVPHHRNLLVAMLQILLAFSCYKSPVLLFKLDVGLLGHNVEVKDSVNECPKLPTLMPLILPRNQLRMSTPWLTVLEQADEMQEKIKLAKSLTSVSEDYDKQLQKAKTWHQTALSVQSKDSQNRPTSLPQRKVKVKSGATPSQQRVPVDFEKELSPTAIRQRRDHAHSVLQDRLDVIDQRRKDGLVKLYLPYIQA